MNRTFGALILCILSLTAFTLALDYATDHSLFGADILVPAFFGETADTQFDSWALHLEDFMVQYANPLYYWEAITQH